MKHLLLDTVQTIGNFFWCLGKCPDLVTENPLKIVRRQIPVCFFERINAGAAVFDGILSKREPGVHFLEFMVFIGKFQSRGTSQNGQIIGRMPLIQPLKKGNRFGRFPTVFGKPEMPAHVGWNLSGNHAVVALMEIDRVGAVLDLGSIFRKGDDHGQVSFGKFRKHMLIGRSIRAAAAQSFYKTAQSSLIFWRIDLQTAVFIKKVSFESPHPGLKFQGQLFIEFGGNGGAVKYGGIRIEFPGKKTGNGVEFFPGFGRTQGKTVVFFVLAHEVRICEKISAVQ